MLAISFYHKVNSAGLKSYLINSQMDFQKVHSGILPSHISFVCTLLMMVPGHYKTASHSNTTITLQTKLIKRGNTTADAEIKCRQYNWHKKRSVEVSLKITVKVIFLEAIIGSKCYIYKMH